MKFFKNSLFLFLLLPLTVSAQSGLDTLGLKDIFYEPLLAGNRADFVRFSTDGSSIFYSANDSAMIEEEIFKVTLTGENRQLADGSFIRSYERSFNQKMLAYTDEGDIWLSDLQFSDPRKIIATADYEYDINWGPDSLRFAFIQGGDVMIMDVEDVQITQVTDKKENEPGFNIIAWAGSGRLIVQQYDNSEVKTVYFPEYIGEWVQPGATKRGLGRRIISVINLKTDSVEILYEGKKYVDVEISASGRYAAFDKIDTSMKHRVLQVFDFKNDTSHIVFSDSTDGWFAYSAMNFAPEGNRLMFHSEKDGWNHLYLVNPDGSNLKQVTQGAFEVPWAEWLSDQKIIFASTKVDPGERHLYIMNLENEEITRLTYEPGFREYFSLSADKQHVVYSYTYFNKPYQLYTINLNDPDKEIQLTFTTPERFKKIDWQKPDYFRFTGRDGETKISMRVLEPRDLLARQSLGEGGGQGKQYPVVVFVHGAGSLQNVYKGWSNHYWREYMFNQILTEHGYFVMQVDYRHSLGYGRDFRDKVTGWMGKYETHDIVDGLKYLAEHYPQADTSRVGIYGGSYGGFMALYATSVAPEHFDAAAALRAVTNWINYYRVNPWYTKPRLGTPEADSLNYARSSPLTYVDQLKQPVLILHGLMDNNVPFRDAAQYISKLIQAGDKEFYMMMYPAERHSFEDPDAWYDEYSRIYEFFNRELKNSSEF